ncbi:zinc finger protein 239-like isoform X1 [Achroia grisella]|nr:zinc finger protein 239-like isoform X1 [Achroia grisella]
MVFYGSEFANSLHIDLRKYNSPPGYAAKFGVPSKKQPSQEYKRKSTHAKNCNKENEASNKVVLNERNINLKSEKQTSLMKKIEKSVNKSTENYDVTENNDNRVSNNENQFPCSDCGQKFDTQNIFNQHIAKHNHIKSKMYLNCDICDFRDIAKISLERHIMKVHPTNLYFVCEYCNESFKSKNCLEDHVLTCSRKFREKVHSRTHSGEKPNECTICHSRYSQKGSLKVHLRTHSGEKPYECTICQYRCSVKGKLKIHLRTHSGEKPYECTICQYRCSKKGNLKIHLRTHSGEKPYECTICQYRCSEKGSLKVHLRTHSGEKPYECTICQYRCSQKGDLKRHLRTHSGEKPYECTICQYRCSQKSNLKTHLKTHNKQVY